MEVAKISENKIKFASNGDEILVKSLWENQDCVIIFFRRFGCSLCRFAAKKLSGIKSKLDAHNVRLVGIGVEELGVEEFIEGNFFNGDLLIDVEKKCYKDFEYKRYGMFNFWPALLSKGLRDGIAQASADNISGNLKGDAHQLGGTLVVTKGGDKVLLNHKQESFSDHVDPIEILKILNIDVSTNSDNNKTEESVE